MQIIVYSKPGCTLCAGFKEKLVDKLKVPFAERNLEAALAQCETWRQDGTVEVMSAHAMIAENVPLVLIDGAPYNYADALAEIKKRVDAGEMVEMPKSVPGDGKDRSTEVKEMSEAQFVAWVFQICNNCVDTVRVTSRARRLYDGKSPKLWKLEVEGLIHVEIALRNPSHKPMTHPSFQTQADDFKTLLMHVETRVREMLKKDQL